MNNAIRCENLVKIYKSFDSEVMALQGLDLTIESGDFIAIIGASGSGKSTLLNIIGGLLKPSAGSLFVNDCNILKLTEKEASAYRRKTVGFVWQKNSRNMIPYLNCFDNILNLMFDIPKKQKKERTKYLLKQVGLLHKSKNYPSQLSGGEQQRIAIAVGLANDPEILLADEPTGSVDLKTMNNILKLLKDINKTTGKTIIIVTHDTNITKIVGRVVSIRDGKISSEILSRAYYQRQYSGDSFKWGDESELEESLGHLLVLDKNGRVQIPEEYLKETSLLGEKYLNIERNDKSIILTKA